jgi:hypothetical protein
MHFIENIDTEPIMFNVVNLLCFTYLYASDVIGGFVVKFATIEPILSNILLIMVITYNAIKIFKEIRKK